MTTTITKSHILKLVREHGSKTAVARKLGVSRHRIDAVLKGNEVTNIASVETASRCGRKRSLSEFRAQYDKGYIVPRRIRSALAQLGNGWLYELEFAKFAGVSLSDLGMFRDEFADYIVQIARSGRRAWAGTKTTAAKMREML